MNCCKIKVSVALFIAAAGWRFRGRTADTGLISTEIARLWCLSNAELIGSCRVSLGMCLLFTNKPAAVSRPVHQHRVQQPNDAVSLLSSEFKESLSEKEQTNTNKHSPKVAGMAKETKTPKNDHLACGGFRSLWRRFRFEIHTLGLGERLMEQANLVCTTRQLNSIANRFG